MNVVKYTAKFRELPPQASTQYFAMDLDEVPAAGGSRPDRLAAVSGPQERVQRHFVEHLVEPVRGVPVLDALVPQMVNQLTGFLKHDVVQVIDVPAHRFPLLAADGGAAGGGARARGSPRGARPRLRWHRMAPVRGDGRDLLVYGAHDFGFTASPGRDINTGQG